MEPLAYGGNVAGREQGRELSTLGQNRVVGSGVVPADHRVVGGSALAGRLGELGRPWDYLNTLRSRRRPERLGRRQLGQGRRSWRWLGFPAAACGGQKRYHQKSPYCLHDRSALHICQFPVMRVGDRRPTAYAAASILYIRSARNYGFNPPRPGWRRPLRTR